MIQIIHSPTESEPFVIAKKNHGLPSAPLKQGDDCALFRVAEIYPEVLNVHGKKEIEGGLIHRIDNDTEGLLLISASQKFYDEMMVLQKNGKFRKHYTAYCMKKDVEKYMDGFPKKPQDVECLLNSVKKLTICSKFRTYSEGFSNVRPVTSDSGKAALRKCGPKEYVTEVSLDEEIDGIFKFSCALTEGFKHQVRCHLAWCGFPIVGDKVYNNDNAPEMKFYADGLEFMGFSFSYLPNDAFSR